MIQPTAIQASAERPNSTPNFFSSIRWLVFLPTFSVLLSALIFSLKDLAQFVAWMKTANTFVLSHFSWLFSLGSFYLLVLAVIVYASPLGNIRIGGVQAKPLIKKRSWFMIVLCTTLAVGVLFWATAEPLYHYHYPPKSLGIEAASPNSLLFAISTMFLHWGPTPYSIYAIPGLVFALTFYNLKQPFTITSSLQAVSPWKIRGAGSDLIDSLALFSLVVGMASSLGTGALTIVGGLADALNLNEWIASKANKTILLGIVIGAIVSTFVISAASGLTRGIARLSSVNFWLLILLFLFIFLLSHPIDLLSIGLESLGVYLNNFFRISLFTGVAAKDTWAQDWSVFYWAVWFAWAPITAMFIGKIAKGYTVREFLRFNILYPSLFIVLWITAFAGSALMIDQQTNGELVAILNQDGIEKLLYVIFAKYPFSGLTTLILLFVAFISYVTAADSSTDAIGDLCTKDFTAESDSKASLGIKVLWGVIIALVSWIMVSTVGVDGIKALSNLGGLPATLIILASSLSLFVWINHPEKLKCE